MNSHLPPYTSDLFIPVSVDEFEFVDVDSSDYHELVEQYYAKLISADEIYVGVASPSGQLIWVPVSEADVRLIIDRLALYRVPFRLESRSVIGFSQPTAILWIG